jgi:apolipoprotein D and lipocalin family protein
VLRKPLSEVKYPIFPRGLIVKIMAASWVGVMVVAIMVVCCRGADAASGRSLLQATCPSPQLPDVNMPAYLGVWYEIASTALIKARTEANLACITAHYSLMPDGKTIRVRNDGYNESSGEINTVIGTASVMGRSLRVSFPRAPAADYRIIYIKGDVADRYKTAVVYSCDAGQAGGFQSLYILSRTPSLDKDESVSGITDFARTQGITLEPSNQLVLTDQGSITCGRNLD